VLAAKGMVEFLRVTGALVPAVARRLPSAAAPQGMPGPVGADVIRVWSRMVQAHAP
jgi:hypothetical protein